MAIDKSGANAAAIVRYNVKHEITIVIRTCKYLNCQWGMTHPQKTFKPKI
jgi:hypothetical protein